MQLSQDLTDLILSLNMPTLKVRVYFVLIVVVGRACGLENRYFVSGGYIYTYTLGAKGICGA